MEPQEQEIDLKDLFALLLSKIKFIILVTILGMAVAFAYAKIVLPVEYTSSVSIYVKNSDSSGNDQQATQSDLAAAKSLAGTYIVILDDDVVYDYVSQMLIEDYEVEDLKNFFTVNKTDNGYEIPAKELRSKVSLTTVNDTEVIKIQATTESAQISADICTYIYGIAPDLLKRVTKAGYVEKIGDPKVPDSPSSPNVKLITIIGVLIGLVLSVGIVIISNLLDNCVSTADDIRSRYSIPVLAEIPDLEIEDKEASRYEY